MTTPPSASEPYKLRRARKGRMLAGVAGGLATASGLDVTVVRICIGVSMLTGLGVIGYILLWLVIPEEQPSRGRFVEPAPESTARVIRVVLLGGALLVLLQRLGVFWPFETRNVHTGFGFDGVLALILLSLGIGVLVSRHRSDAWASDAPPTATGATTTVPAPGEPFTPWTAPGVIRPTEDDAPSAEYRFDDDLDDDWVYDERITDDVSFTGPLRGVAETVHRDVTTAMAGVRSGEGRAKKPGGGALGWARVFGWLMLLWWIGGLFLVLVLWRFGAVQIVAPVVLFTAAWVVFTIVIHALIRVRKPTVLLATTLALLVPIGIAQGTVAPDGPVGSRIVRPLAVSETISYRQAIGELQLDFSNTRFNAARSTKIAARMGTGELVVTLPDDVSVTVISRIDAGGYDVLGRRTAGGIGQRETLRFEGCEGAPHLQLRIRGGAGWLEVNRDSGSDQALCPPPVASPPA